MTSIDQILQAMRADTVPSGESGTWIVEKWNLAKGVLGPRDVFVPPGSYTTLRCATDETVHVGGECVMVDHEAELRTHLAFILKARGHVLVTGLGLGCVVRGLLSRPEVEFVDVVEIEQSVIDLVGRYMPTDPRLRIHHADALKFDAPGPWDFAWHDIWCDGNERLAVLHAELIWNFYARVKPGNQGAWNFPRKFKRVFGIVA